MKENAFTHYKRDNTLGNLWKLNVRRSQWMLRGSDRPLFH